MANNLNEEQRKWILKKYWKYENAETVRKVWQEAFHTPPPSRLTIYRLRNKFDKTGSVSNAPKTEICAALCVRVFWTGVKNVAMLVEDILST